MMESQNWWVVVSIVPDECDRGIQKANLVDHHDGEQIADCGEEKPIEIVRRILADHDAEDVEDDLADDEEEYAEADVEERPAVLQRVDHKHDLHHEVDEQEYAIEDVENHEEADRVCGTETRPAFEGEERDDEGDGEQRG